MVRLASPSRDAANSRPRAQREQAYAGKPRVSALPDRVLVLGDLHMGAGQRPDGTPDPLEHFFQDDELETVLARIAARAARRGRRYTLVLNGDVFDFVRTVRLPGSAWEAQAWRELLHAAGVIPPQGVIDAAAADQFTVLERRYGLDGAEHESVWKLLAISQGHPRVFEALARWCAAGHDLVVVRGNHDVEWAWPGVRRALRVLLRRAGAGALRRGQVSFRMHRYARCNLHVEHGHAIRWSTFVEGRYTTAGGRSLRQPFGSFINRFVLNPIERVAHRAPGLSSSAHLKRQLRHEPFRIWRGLLHHALRALPPLGRATWRIWHRRAHYWWPTRLGNAIAAAVLLLPLLWPDLLAAFALDTMPARAGAALLAVAMPHLGLALLETFAHVRDDPRRRALRLARRICARGAATPEAERIVVLGHTHRTELTDCSAEGLRGVYANPGCWLGEDAQQRVQPRLVWCALQDGAYRRARILDFDGRSAQCRTRSKR